MMTTARKHMGSVAFGTIALLLFFIFAAMNDSNMRSALAQTTPDHSFTYQGYLENGGSPVNANCDFRFQLYGALTGGSQIGPTLNVTNLSVDRGVFSTTLNFGNVFSTQKRWLSIAVRCPAGSGDYTALTPRTEVTGAPLSGAMRNLITDPSTGFIGINRTTSPSYWLDVNGSIQTSSQLRVIDSNETLRARVGQGSVETFDSSGTRRAMIEPGGVNVYDSSGSRRALVGTPASGPGIVQTWGQNGLSNARLTSLGGFPNNGFVAVQDSVGTTRAGIHVDSSGNGIVWGDTKNFRIPNPNDAETEIWYASLEGPEAAAYMRGTAQLVDGQATITFPDHFLAVASEAGMTIQLTPLSADSLGLAVVQKSLAGVTVQELHRGTGTYEFDFFITAVRQGYEDYKVIRPAIEAQPAGEGTESITPVERDDRAAEMEGDR